MAETGGLANLSVSDRPRGPADNPRGRPVSVDDAAASAQRVWVRHLAVSTPAVEIQLFFHPDDHYVHVQVVGAFRLDDVLEGFQGMVACPEYSPGLHAIIDFRRASFAALGRDELLRIQEMLVGRPDRHHVRKAWVVEDRLGYGVLRMADLLGENVPQNRAIFSTVSAARQWLLS